MPEKTPFDDLGELIAQFPGPDESNQAEVARKMNNKLGVSCGGFAELIAWLAAWQGAARPQLSESHICILVSSYEGAGDIDFVLSFADRAGKGQTAVNHLCKDRGLGLRVLEMAPTIPHVVNDAWPEKDCMAACAFGMEATAAGGDLLGLSSLAPGSAEYCQNLIEKLSLKNKDVDVCERPTARPLNEMRSRAGREVAASVGAIVAARSRRIPVMVEGWSSLAALCILHEISPAATDHVQVASIACEDQRKVAMNIGKPPIIGLPVTMGPGCGIAVAVSSIAPLLALLSG